MKWEVALVRMKGGLATELSRDREVTNRLFSFMFLLCKVTAVPHIGALSLVNSFALLGVGGLG